MHACICASSSTYFRRQHTFHAAVLTCSVQAHERVNEQQASQKAIPLLHAASSYSQSRRKEHVIDKFRERLMSMTSRGERDMSLA